MKIFVSIGVKRLKYQNMQILDLRYQKMRMTQSDCRKFTKEVPKGDTTGEKYLWGCLYLFKKGESCLLENKYMFHLEKRFTKEVIIYFAWETRRLPTVSLVKMFKVNKRWYYQLSAWLYLWEVHVY